MSQYFKQLTSECDNPECFNVFCRKIHNNVTVNEVIKILSDYDDLFYCRNIKKIISTPQKIMTQKYQILDLYFYLDCLIYLNNIQTNHSPREFKLKSNKVVKDLVKSTKSKIKLHKALKPTRELEHSYCDIVNGQPSQVDIYILIGIVHLLINKFSLFPDFNIALIIIRLFILISKTSYIENSYYKKLLEVYEFTYKCFINSLVKTGLVEISNCRQNKMCLFQFCFTKVDFKESLETVSRLLNNSLVTDIRENPKLKYLLEILKILYKINEKTNLTEYEDFYVQDFASRVNIKLEFRHLKLAQESVLKYEFMLPVNVKSEVLKLGNGDTMKNTLQDSFFRALFEGVTEPYLFLTIRRENIYHDTLRLLTNFDDADLKKQLKIKFQDEEGVDSGGIRKEYFQLLSQEISHDRNIFDLKNNRVWFQPGVDKDQLCIIGKLIGIALYNDVVLNIPFPSILFKKMLDISLDFKDLAEIEPDICNSITNLETCSEKEIKELDLYFTIDYELNGQREVKELFPDGSKMQITKSNFLAFKMACLEFYTSKMISKEFEAFMNGFHTVIKKKTIASLKPRELEKIIMGTDILDILGLKNSTVYNGYTPDNEVVKNFWSILENYSLENKKKLLQFVTGNDRIPITGPENLKLVIMKNGCDTERLPSSQTCFNTLLLPEYSSKNKLYQKLTKAINMTTGFYLL